MLRPVHKCWSIAVVVGLTASVGCSPAVRWPNLYHPGPAAYQRAEAVVHDPYPLDDVGPPIVGGRPLGYQKPVPEVERARMFSPRRATVPLTIPFTNTQIMPPPSPQAVPAPYTSPQPVPAPYSAPQAPPLPSAVTQPPPALPPAAPPPVSTPYTAPPPVPAPYSAPIPAAPPAPYQYTPATPLQAFPSRAPY